MILAFSGPSGSGKSTLIESLPFEELFPGQKIHFFEEDTFFLLKLIKGIAGSGSFLGFKSQTIHQEKQARGIRHYLMRLFYPLIIYTEFLIKFLYFEILFPKKVAVMDRYVYDYWVTLRCNLQILGPINDFLFSRFPRPYLSIYIKVGLEELTERNKNPESPRVSDSKFQEDVLAAYTEISERTNMLEVENVGSLETAVGNITRHIRNKSTLSKVKEIVIIGLDGSGKSTLCENLSEYLRKLNIQNFVAHFYHDPVLYKILKRAGYYERKLGHLSEEEIMERGRQHNIKARKSGRSFFWAALHFVDSWFQYLFFKLIGGGRVIIFDRFFYDFLGSFKYLRVPRQEVFERLIPGVENAFFLSCPPEICFERKPENTKEFFEENHKFYVEIADKYDLEVIDSMQGSPQEVLTDLIGRVGQ